MIQYDVLTDLIDIKTNDNKTLLHDLVDMFVKQTPDRLRQIDLAIQQKNKDQITRVAHMLKASCSYLGAVEMTTLCTELEKLGLMDESLNTQAAKIWLSALEDSYDESASELTNYISEVLH